MSPVDGTATRRGARAGGRGRAKWRWLPTHAIVVAGGLLAVSTAYTAARFEVPGAMLLYVLGLATIAVPAAYRLVSSATPRDERLGLVMLLGLALFLVKLLHSPLGFAYFDEFQHWRTAMSILDTNALFGSNSLLPISPRYPGLENATVALVGLADVSVFVAGQAVILTARLLLVLTMFLLIERASGSARLAGIAVFVYVANPHFIYFNAQFAYESLALPLTAFTFYCVALRTDARGRVAALLTVLIVLGIASVVVTHHVSSIAMTAFLWLWALVHARVRPSTIGVGPGDAAVLALVLSAGWVVFVAPDVRDYIGYHLLTGLDELLRLATGELELRQLFASGGVVVAPAWERVLTVAAVGLLVASLPIGAAELWRNYRGLVLPLALGIAAFGYPATLALRLTEAGMEAAGRAMTFVFAPLGFMTALAVVGTLARLGETRRTRALLTAAAATVFLGGAVFGAPAYFRLPGPYLVAADPRSIEPQGIETARWAAAWLGPENRVAADRINRVLLGTHGRQRPVTSLQDDVVLGNLFIPDTFDAAALEVLRAGRIEYVVVDLRLSTGLPHVGVYFNLGEPYSLRHVTPISPAALLKFDRLPGASRAYDSGDIRIFDVRGSSDAR
jgi:hypothetical protein